MQKLLTQAEKLADRGETFAEKFGNYLVDGFQLLALFVIGATIVWSAADAYLGLVGKSSASVEDILLLFIFLELGAMVGIYFKTNRLPVQFLLYVAITVLTRSLRDHRRHPVAGRRGVYPALRVEQVSVLRVPRRNR
jgi:phosphate starvation-inducible membrane PsiE